MAELPKMEIQLPADDAFKRLVAAGNKIGKVEESNELARYVIVKARFGLNTVRVRAAILTGTETTSYLEIQGRGQDVWGAASRKVMDRLISEL